MTEISAGRVKQLREMTGAGMMDCKRALVEAEGDVDAAVDWLRKKGLAAAAKKSGRVAAEGLIGIAVVGGRGAMAEVNTETDFVSRNPDFQAFARQVAALALEAGGDIEALRAMSYPGTDRSVNEEVTHLIASIGENMQVRRSAALEVSPGIVASYVHNAQAPDLGKIGVLVGLQSEADAAVLLPLGKHLAMHVAAASPQFLSRDDVDAAALERERAVLSDQARASGKPENIIEKMVEGRLRRFYEESCMLEQVFVVDTEKKVQEVIDAAAKDAGTAITVTGFARFALGEGVDKEEKSFADEVAQAAGT